MTASPKPFALPQTLTADFDRVKAYWHGLLRGSAEIPFADDLSLEDLADLKGKLVLVEVFELPERFRFAYIGADIAAAEHAELNGKFLDEVALPFPCDFLRAQCTATVEAGAPSYHAQAADREEGHAAYTRLVLPLWGDGHISLLLVATDGL